MTDVCRCVGMARWQKWTDISSRKVSIAKLQSIFWTKNLVLWRWDLEEPCHSMSQPVVNGNYVRSYSYQVSRKADGKSVNRAFLNAPCPIHIVEPMSCGGSASASLLHYSKLRSRLRPRRTVPLCEFLDLGVYKIDTSLNLSSWHVVVVSTEAVLTTSHHRASLARDHYYT